MFRIDNATAAGSLPSPGAAGTPGFFQPGNPGLSIPATIVTADWANGIQEEIMSVLTAASITESKTSFNQLLNAIKALIGLNVSFGSQAFSTNGSHTYTPTAGMAAVLTILTGGGGSGGGGYDATSSGGAGGAAGGTAIAFLTAAQIGTSKSLTLGVGGTGGIHGLPGSTGTNGGTSSLGALLSATGGVAGGYGNNSNAATPGAGGVGSGGVLNLTGQGGSPGRGSATAFDAFCFAGVGANSFFGGGGLGGMQTNGQGGTGNNGSGGGGSTGATNGGNGGDGCALFIEFIIG